MKNSFSFHFNIEIFLGLIMVFPFVIGFFLALYFFVNFYLMWALYSLLTGIIISLILFSISMLIAVNYDKGTQKN
jgi:hypothetical protein